MENKIQEILNKYEIKEDFFSYLRTFSSNIDFERKKLFPLKELSINNELVNVLYGNSYLKTLEEQIIEKKKEDFFFKSGDPELNLTLEGGFYKGKLYQIIGPSLSGKTTLVNSIINENINLDNIQILCFSFINENININDLSNYKKINIITECLSINEVILYLSIPENNIEKYNLIIFDPITAILSRDIKEDLIYVDEFQKILNKLIYKFNACVILTGMVKKLKVIQLTDIKNNKIYEVREYYSFIPHSIHFNETQIALYKIERKNFDSKYYAKVNSPYLYTSNCFFEINYNSENYNMEIDNY